MLLLWGNIFFTLPRTFLWTFVTW